MRKITILYDGTAFTFKWVKTLFWARNCLREKGYIVSFPNMDWALPRRQKDNQDILNVIESNEYDIVCLAFHHSTSELGKCDVVTRSNILKKLKSRCNSIIWLDTADSTGTCLFDVLPYVDKYLKKQLLKDIKKYEKPIWGGRLFCEYLHKEYAIEDSQLEKESYTVLTEENRNKIGLSWNMGLSDFRDWKWSFILRNSLNPLPKDCIPINKKRLDTYFNGTVNDSITGWQRKQCQLLLLNDKSINCGEVSYRVSSEIYQHEIRDTKSIISPFGWGEICFRDFEAFQFHAVLIKPSLDHLDTWPPFFIENETYLPIDWNLDGLYSAIDRVKTNQCIDIANNGYDLYHYYRSNRAKEEFSQHFVKNIEEV